MKRTGLAVLIVVLLIQGCAPVMVGVGGAHTANTPTATVPRATAAGVTGYTGLAAIPLGAGIGVDGGWFQLYFSDPSNPIARQFTGGPEGPLVAAIESSRLSVDAALYSLTLDSIRAALIQAHRRGVNVRVVMESDNMDNTEPRELIDAGIPLIGDRHEGLMHDKFVVIDRSQVWTGSMNLTYASAYQDRNNLIRIRSSQVAEDYEAEFNEMFSKDKFGGDRGDPTPNPRVIIEGTPLDVYFSPDDHVQAALLDLLANAQSSVDFLAYSFTADPLREAILERARAGVAVRGVMDADQVRSNIGTEFDAFRSAGLQVRLDGEDGYMHDKVMIIDGNTVVTGSYNFTASAEQHNDENVIVIYSPQLAAQFEKEFQRIFAVAQP